MSGSWCAVADEARESVEGVSARGEEGLVTGWEDFSVGGYPYRIEARFETPAASAPETPEAGEWRGERAAVALLPHNVRHAAVVLATARDGGSERDIRGARAQFLKLKPSDRRAALAMIAD